MKQLQETDSQKLGSWFWFSVPVDSKAMMPLPTTGKHNSSSAQHVAMELLKLSPVAIWSKALGENNLANCFGSYEQSEKHKGCGVGSDPTNGKLKRI